MTHNLISGQQALAMVANRPPKRIVRQLESGDRVHMPTVESGGWCYGRPFPGKCPEMLWANAEVYRPSTGQTFMLPVFISYFINEIKDVDGNMHVCTVDDVDLDKAESFAEQAMMLAGCIFEVHVDTFQAWETTREGAKRQRERSTYDWIRCA